MPLRFDDVYLPPLAGISLDFDDATIAGVAGPNGAGKSLLLELAAGTVAAERGRVEAPSQTVLIRVGPGDSGRIRQEIAEAAAAATKVLLIDHALSLLDGAAQVHCIQQLHRLRRRGSIVLISSHDLCLLARICDVVIALDNGRIAEQGDPGLVLANYRRRTLERSRMAGALTAMIPSSRRGDGRAEVASIEIRDASGNPTTTVRSGELITVSAELRFLEPVENPVAGILIRNRIGVCVYGTNTELEQTPIGFRRAGEAVRVEFQFACDLCPQEYTLTVASHDPNGAEHDWLEDAVLFSVVDSRYTAGIANLRAKVAVK